MWIEVLGVAVSRRHTAGRLLAEIEAVSVEFGSVQRRVAAAGYDTEKFRGDDKAYSELDPCCQYDRAEKAPAKKGE